MNSCSLDNDADIVVTIRPGTDHTNTPVATGVIPNASIPYVDGCGAGSGTTALFAGAELSDAPSVTSGEVYTIWAHSSDSTDEYGWWGDQTDNYAGGTSRTRTSVGNFPHGFDLGFKTYVIVEPSGETSAGEEVLVEPPVTLPGGSTTSIALTFDNVTTAGETAVTSSIQGPPPPAGFKLTNPPVYFEITSTATFNGNVRVCLGWSEGQIANESNVSMFHHENNQWVDITDPTSRDTVNNKVCGTASSLSPFTLFEVKYPFTGFFAPVENAPTMNAVKAGAAVPVKFSLGGDLGLDIFVGGYPRAQLMQCDTLAPVDEITETVTAGGSSLAYDPESGRYTYVWKTDKAWANSCRELQLKLTDGETYRARFTFRK